MNQLGQVNWNIINFTVVRSIGAEMFLEQTIHLIIVDNKNTRIENIYA